MKLSNYAPLLYINIHATAVANSGTTGNFICVNKPCNNKDKVNNGTFVGMLDGNTLRATHKASLNLTHLGIDLPLQALEASMFQAYNVP